MSNQQDANQVQKDGMKTSAMCLCSVCFFGVGLMLTMPGIALTAMGSMGFDEEGPNVAGIVLLVIGPIILISAAIFCCCTCRKAKQRNEEMRQLAADPRTIVTGYTPTNYESSTHYPQPPALQPTAPSGGYYPADYSAQSPYSQGPPPPAYHTVVDTEKD